MILSLLLVRCLSSCDVFWIRATASLTAAYLLCYLWVVKSTLHADNHTRRCIYSRAEEQHWLMSMIDSRVRQTGTCWADIGVQSSDRKFGRWDEYSETVQKIKCHADDSCCTNSNCSPEGFFGGRPHTHLAEVDSWKQEHHLKGYWKSLFIVLTDSVHYFQPNTFSVLYKQQGL